MKNFYAAISLLLLISKPVSAQHYSLLSQYMYNGLMINPAYAGTNGATDITFSTRRQWTGLSESPATSVVSLNSPLQNEKLNLGFIFVDDKIGPASRQTVNGIYAYRLKMGTYRLSFGIQAGLQFSRTNWDELLRNDQNDDLLLGLNPRAIGATTGAGLYLNNNNSFFSLSAPYLVNTGSYKAFGYGPVILNAGLKISMKDSSQIKPSFLFRYEKGSPVQFDLGFLYSWKKKVGLGAAYRFKESIIAMLEIPLQEQFLLVYSYDAGIGPIKKYHNGSHEIMLRYIMTKAPVKELKDSTKEAETNPDNEKKEKPQEKK